MGIGVLELAEDGYAFCSYICYDSYQDMLRKHGKDNKLLHRDVIF